MRGVILAVVYCVWSLGSWAQLFTYHPVGDTTTSLSVEGYVDVYYSFDANQPKPADKPYLVSYSRHRETNINLAYISMKYAAPRTRAVVTPGFGTYMNANYAAERATLRHVVEANVGVKLWKDKDVWLDAGVMPTPYTTETAVALNQLLYSRSLAADNCPYYVTGGRLSLPLLPHLRLSLYAINGWQVIEDKDARPSGGWWVEATPNKNLSLNWCTYVGNEAHATLAKEGTRYFNNAYVLYNPSERWALSGDAYIGLQRTTDARGSKGQDTWWQANLNARYAVSNKAKAAARLEYFSDPNGVIIVPIAMRGFRCLSATVCYTYAFAPDIYWRVESRAFLAERQVYLNSNQGLSNNSVQFTTGLVARF
jgi:hypothetical protein